MNEKRDEMVTEPGDLRLSALMKNLPGMVYRCRNDKDWTMEFVSEGCFKLTGFPTEALINNAHISYAGLIHPEDRYYVWTGVNQGIDEDKPFSLTYRIIADGGSEKWVYEQGQGIFDDNHNLLAIEGFITDVSEQKRFEQELADSLKEKSLLLSEIHHRIKNNMQLIISMLELQKGNNPSCNEVFDAAVERVRVFSDLHQQLYSYESQALIDIDEQIRKIFHNLLLAFRIPADMMELQLEIEGPNLDFDTSIPLGLMINELISNAFKHVFREESGWIRIMIITNSDGRLECLEYSDSGRDLGEASGGFGVLLLEAMAAQLELNTELISEGSLKFKFTK